MFNDKTQGAHRAFQAALGSAARSLLAKQVYQYDESEIDKDKTQQFQITRLNKHDAKLLRKGVIAENE